MTPGEWRLNRPLVKEIGDDDDADAAQRHYFRLMEARRIGTQLPAWVRPAAAQRRASFSLRGRILNL